MIEVPFVSFKPMERELNKELREAFERVFNASWYIEGRELWCEFLCGHR